MRIRRTALAGLALAVITAGTATPATARTARTASAVTARQAVPPVNPDALRRAIAGLPDAEGTAAQVRVGGSGGSWQGVSGVRDLRSRRPVPANARFRAGSVTKVFTAAVVLQLVAEGELHLDRTVQYYLPGLLPENYRPVTVGQLLNHTSGLPPADLAKGLPAGETADGFTWIYKRRFEHWTPERIVALATQDKMEFEPGTAQHYLNINYTVAGMLIEKITGSSYERQVRERILRPLGLRDTFLPTDDPFLHGPHTNGYQVLDGRTIDVTVWGHSIEWAAGNLVSTTADLERFTTALFRGDVVPAPQLELMFTVPPKEVRMYGDAKEATYSMGLTRVDLPGGIVLWGKTGGRYGYLTGIGGLRNPAGAGEPPRTLVYSYNSVDAKSESVKPRMMDIIITAFS
ncbi:serine hydrolase domain-containing protein [Nonomuraea sp. SBT364]|uniref:serine hydrolase domain-containing protein n=1 Tax=Nonomuraea sp. SBT364 TaxID=1580530 RepID=UPI000B2BD662|nr:serine hydrolase domain-containing protein [Nonomuraea sp. SBT364]